VTSYVLALDQGTTSTRAILFRADTSIAAVAQQEFPQHFPADGEVEHEPEDLWATAVETCRGAMREAGATARDIVSIGITNQRETTLLWDRATGRPLHRAIVWQDRRTADLCARLREAGHEKLFAAKTGLVLDPYFSGTKLAWLLNRAPDVAERAARGELMAYRHGFRVSELVDLRWDQIDFDRGTLAVRRAKRGTPSTHPIMGDELRALRKLQREQEPKSPFR